MKNHILILENALAKRIHELELANGRYAQRIYDLETDTKFGHLNNSITNLCVRIDKVESVIEELSATVQELEPADTELSSCPFCGEDEAVVATYNDEFFVECSDCECRTFRSSKSDVIKAWNTRS